jgi:hypothetical protein
MLKFVLYLRKFPDVAKQCLSIKCSHSEMKDGEREDVERVSEYSNKWNGTVCLIFVCVYVPSNTFQDESIVFSL